MQAGSNEIHPNTKSKILNHVNKKDVPMSGIQWSQHTSYTFEDKIRSGFSVQFSKESLMPLSFLICATCLLDEVYNSDIPCTKMYVFKTT